jgi:heme A synthase
MTGLDSVAVIAMCVWAFRVFPRRHAVRLFSVLSLVFLLVEALLGAGLVLLRYVAQDQSSGRAWYLSAHLTNTLLLLAALTVTAWMAYRNAHRLHLRNASQAVIGAVPIVAFVSITGVIAALGDTLFPAASLSAGMRQDFASASSLLLRLRLFHPLIAVAGGVYLIWAATVLFKRGGPDHARTAATRVLGLTLFQLAVGAVNLALLAPVWMQLIHLFVADVLWIAVVLMVLEAPAVRTPPDLAVSVGAQPV